MSTPRWIRALLARLAEPDVRDEVMGDLEEAHRSRTERRGRVIATIVTSLEALDMAFALRWQRRRMLRRLGRAVPPNLRTARRRMMPTVSWLDFRLGLRMLVRYPAMSVVGCLAMALGIAIGATVFQFVTELIFPDHPYADASRIVGIQSIDTRTGGITSRTLHDLGIWQAELTTVDHVGAHQRIRANLDIGDGRPEPVEGVAISASAFRLAPVPPVLGRPLLESDEGPNGLPVTVLAYELWQSRFGGEEDVIGRVVRVGVQQTTVVGVMPAGFALHVPSNDLIYVGSQALWLPFRLDPGEYAPGEGPSIDVFGRLAAGVTASQAQAELSNLGAALAAAAPATHQRITPRIATFSNPFGGLDRGLGVRSVTTLMALFVAAVIVTLCANVALLLFARAASRENELVVRSALGAGRTRIVMQLFAEAVALAVVALGLGWLGASVALGWLVDMVTTIGVAEGLSQPPIDAALAPRTMAYAAALAVGGAVVAGVLPGIKVTGKRMGESLGRVGRGSVSTLGRTWGAIIVLQVAITATLVPIAILLGLQTWEATFLDRGFPAEEYLSMRIEMDREQSRDGVPLLDDDAFQALYEERVQELARRARAETGVMGVAMGDLPGFDHGWRTLELEDAAGPADVGAIEARVYLARVDPEFFDTFGLRLLAGRVFDSRDQVEGANAVIVNESFVRHRMGGGSAVGRWIRLHRNSNRPIAESEEPWVEIVGVVSDIVMDADPATVTGAGAYHPRVPATSSGLRMAVHVPGRPAAFAGRLRELAARTSPALRLRHPLTLDRAGGGRLAIYSLIFRIIVVVGGFALLLTNAGIYAVTAFTVSRRTREIGVRVALGAERRDIVFATLSSMTRRVAIGVLLGSVPGLLLVWELAAGSVRPSAGTAGLVLAYVASMMALCMAACLVPTRKALAIQPTEALAAER